MSTYCFSGCGARVDGGKFCAPCEKALPPLPRATPKARKGGRPRGPTPSADKSLRMLERDLGVILVRLRRKLYDTGPDGMLTEPDYNERLAAQFALLTKDLVPVAKERRQWIEAEFTKQKKMSHAETVEAAIAGLCGHDVAEDDKRRAAEAILASIGGQRRRGIGAVP